MTARNRLEYDKRVNRVIDHVRGHLSESCRPPPYSGSARRYVRRGTSPRPTVAPHEGILSGGGRALGEPPPDMRLS